MVLPTALCSTERDTKAGKCVLKPNPLLKRLSYTVEQGGINQMGFTDNIPLCKKASVKKDEDGSSRVLKCVGYTETGLLRLKSGSKYNTQFEIVGGRGGVGENVPVFEVYCESKWERSTQNSNAWVCKPYDNTFTS